MHNFGNMAAIRRIMFPLALAALPAGASAQNPNIILFMSDNGGLATQPYWRDGEPYTQNAPLNCGKGNPSRGRALVWNFPNIWGNEGPVLNLNCAIRKGDWKLVYYYDTGRKELFNIPDDIGERTNLAARYPGKVRRLSRRLGRYLRSVGADRPAFKESGRECPWPDEVNSEK